MERITTAEDMVELVDEFGFLPFFKNEIPGFSVEEYCPQELWFNNSADGPWEWKGPVVRTKRCMYGKLFCGRAGFVSFDWIPDFANYRRDGFDFDSRYESGLAGYKDNTVFGAISESDSILSKDLKKQCGYSRSGSEKGFDSVIARLQSQTYVCISDFEYMHDKYGKTYGWGVARYSTPETLWGCDFVTSAYKRGPEESKARIVEYLTKLLPYASEKAILKAVG